MNIIIPKAGSGNTTGDAGLTVSTPGSSVGDLSFVGSRGGGAGGPYGLRGSTTAPVPVKGGIGDNGNGANATVGKLSGTFRLGGTAGVGGGNLVGSGNGGVGAQANGLLVTATNILTITPSFVASKINGGNGANGTAPASRPATTGISGGQGGGGGGSWTSGSNGNPPSSPAANVNGKGGLGGAGGIGTVWIMNIV